MNTQPVRFALTCAACVAFGLAALLSYARANHDPLPAQPRACFPAKKWAPAPDRDRPCVFRIYEDGSVDVRQRDGGRVAADD